MASRGIEVVVGDEMLTNNGEGSTALREDRGHISNLNLNSNLSVDMAVELGFKSGPGVKGPDPLSNSKNLMGHGLRGPSFKSIYLTCHRPGDVKISKPKDYV